MNRKRPAQSRAQELLRRVLANGPKPACNVEALAKAMEISQRSLQRARRELGVLTSKTGFGSKGRWLLRLPRAGIQWRIHCH
jgi:hypothetical protein